MWPRGSTLLLMDCFSWLMCPFQSVLSSSCDVTAPPIFSLTNLSAAAAMTSSWRYVTRWQFGTEWLRHASELWRRVDCGVASLCSANSVYLISYHQPSRSLRSSSQSLLHVPRAKTDLDVVLSLLLPKSGTIYLPPLKSHHHLTPSNVTSKHTIISP